jgi:superfamily I DNA/RNA helicase
MKGTFEGSQEEARVWYVGITRTMKRLYLIHDEGKNYPLPMGYV